jgi:predicted 3-demethylubiquinone-9 3-methyltransferase (glyoxalase superfamily)
MPWFDTEAKAAAQHYVSIFPNAKLGKISRYGRRARISTARRRDRS